MSHRNGFEKAVNVLFEAVRSELAMYAPLYKDNKTMRMSMKMKMKGRKMEVQRVFK